uniref:C2H2-type domain-containing protein n=1 Tax=Romanomermis culicivorax TaxID=13658 RepID=A0A915JFI8_ROMCU
MNNIQFKFCPFCPEPLDDDRQVLIHAIGDHTAEYLKFKNQESLESIFEKLPAIKRTILEKRILAKRRNLDDENDEVLEKIDFVSKLDDVKLSPAALNISSLETSKNDEPVAENAPLSCCSSGYQSGTENDQLSKNEDEENPPKIDSYDDQNHKKIDNLIAPESTSFLDESLPILKVENQVQNSNFPAINDQNFKQIDNDGDQHLNQSIINQQDHQIDSVVVVDDRSIISIPELKTTTTLNDDMDVLFGENGFFALNDEISTILTENMASREPLVDPIIAGPASPQPHRCRNGDAPPPPTSNDQFSVLKSILNATPNYAPPAPRTVFTQEMTPVLTPIVQAQTQPLNDPASAFFVERRRAPILPTPAAIFPPQPQPRAILMTPQPPPIFQTTTTLHLLYGGTSLTFVDVVVCRVCRIVAGPTEQVLK